MHRPLALLVATLLALVTGISWSPASASPADDYIGPYFGGGNLPPGCIKDMSRDNPDNICYHAKVRFYALDSPKIDVAVLVPACPTAERDLRILRQSVEAWEGGIDLNPQQRDMDRDGAGGACDKDIDGDGHSKAKERAHGTDPSDPGSYPRPKEGRGQLM